MELRNTFVTGNAGLTASHLAQPGFERTAVVATRRRSSRVKRAAAVRLAGLGAMFLVLPGTADIARAKTATNTWTGNQTTGASANRNQWSQPGNWSGAVPADGSVLVFAGTRGLADNTNNINQGSFRSIVFAAGAGAFTLNGNAIALRHGITNSSANTQTVNLNGITLGGAQTFHALSNHLVFSSLGHITNAGFLLSVDGAFNTTLNGGISGSGGLAKLGAGTLTLTGSNTYTGAIAVQGGLLDLAATAGAAAGAVASVSVAAGATLLVSRSNQVNDAAAVSLSGGTITRGRGASEVFGKLTVSSPSFLDFGNGAAGTFSFGTYTPSALLTIRNFGAGNTLSFGSDLTSSIGNQDLFTFDHGFRSSWDGRTFTVTAIPEPPAFLAAGGFLAVMLWPSRKRLLRYTKRTLGLRRPMRDRLAASRL
jgi:autotransporter-associated beta strand protein